MTAWSARAPGKIILTGEHAVLYGSPALALAVNRHVEARASATADGSWRVAAEGLGEYTIGAEEFLALADRVDARYATYSSGRLAIRDVLDHPLQLVAFALSMLVRDHALPRPEGLSVEIVSRVPTGAGMGSSAAVLLAALAAAGPALDVELTREQLYPLALRGERIRHGESSGLDPYVCLHGGLVRYRHREPTRLALPPGFHPRLVFTGTPSTTTGECVDMVRRHWGRHLIWGDFAAVAEAVERALLAGNTGALLAAVRSNQRLLQTIGVTPAPVARFVRAVEGAGGAAKVCGAGAVHGHAAGVLLALGDPAELERLAQAAGYTLLAVEPESHGVRNA
jgi:mevalonate kinase